MGLPQLDTIGFKGKRNEKASGLGGVAHFQLLSDTQNIGTLTYQRKDRQDPASQHYDLDIFILAAVPKTLNLK